MALTLPVLPGITWPRDKTIGLFDTTIQTSVSGKQTTLINKTQPTYRYGIRISGLDSKGTIAALQAYSLQTLQGFYNKCYGRGLLFQYTDYDDNSVSAQQFGVGDGATLAFRLVRASGAFVDNVFAPTGAPQIYVNNVLKTLGADYSINANTGMVTFVVAPAGALPLTWTGTFNWWCRWDTDSLDFSGIVSGISELQKAIFTTVII
jgi:uncharacterized protein (TIGR02217 family)